MDRVASCSFRVLSPRPPSIRSCRRSMRGNIDHPRRFHFGSGSRVRAAKNALPQVICIGEALFDMLANDFDVPREQVTSWTPKAGGAACNVAAALAKLGVAVSFVSTVGNDDLGHDLIAILKEAGVQVDEIREKSAPTRDVYVTRTSNGEREFVGFGGPADQYADCLINVNELPTRKIQASSVLVSGTLGQAFEQTSEAVRKAVSLARSANVCVMIDVNWRPVFFKDPTVVKDDITRLVKQADLVKLTNDEAEWMFSIDQSTAMTEPNRILECLESAKGVLITAGAEGAAYCFRTTSGLHSGIVPAYVVPVVDTTGAGDAFTSGFVYCMLKCGGLGRLLTSPDLIDDAVEFASASGAVTVSGAGAIDAQPTSPAIIRQLIETAQAI